MTSQMLNAGYGCADWKSALRQPNPEVDDLLALLNEPLPSAIVSAGWHGIAVALVRRTALRSQVSHPATSADIGFLDDELPTTVDEKPWLHDRQDERARSPVVA